MEHKKWRWVCLILVIGVLFVIGWHSMQPGAISHHESQRVLALVRPWVQGTAIAPYVSDGTLRRLAHLAEYAMLGLYGQWGLTGLYGEIAYTMGAFHCHSGGIAGRIYPAVFRWKDLYVA